MGLLFSLLLGPLFQQMGVRLYGVSPFDLVAFGTAGTILAAAALIVLKDES